MNDATGLIKLAIATARPEGNFLSWLLGNHENAIRDGESLVLYGTGNLGRDMLNALRNHGINPIACCDSNPDRAGGTYYGLPIISLHTLMNAYSKCPVLVASQTYAADIKKNLISHGFNKNNILWPADFDMATALFFTPTNQITIYRGKSKDDWDEFIVNNKEKIDKAYSLFEDDKSKQVFIEKIAAMVNYENIGAFVNYIKRNSEPVKDFGLICFKPYGAENFYYFTNDVFQLEDDEIYVDVGAHDGDSVMEFVDACRREKKIYKKIIAFEPDPGYHKQLLDYAGSIRNIQCVDYGIWSKEATFRFKSSQDGIVDGSSGICSEGDIEIKTISLDKFLSGERVTLIKMDPPGNIIKDAIEGAKDTIRRYRPKLILGAYHSPEAIFEIPLLIHDVDPSYRLFLRHNSWGIGETDLYAI